MKRFILIACLLSMVQTAWAFRFEDYFSDTTLRVDYIFSGNKDKQIIALDEMAQWPVWAGRRANINELLLKGNGSVYVSDARNGELLYRMPFSGLFQEWIIEDEASKITRSFEATFLLPKPRQEVYVTVEIYNTRGDVMTSMSHKVSPSDILIRKVDKPVYKWEYVRQGGDSKKCIDVAIVGDGYTAADRELFLKDVRATVEAFTTTEPFGNHIEKFNFIAVFADSEQSGVSLPRKGEWRRTSLRSNFDTFYMDRYLTVSRLHTMHDALDGIPYEHVIVLANTETYGGGGCFNTFAITTAHDKNFSSVMVHEFGHSFAGLADEYYYADDTQTALYHRDVEPWEPNVTTMRDFGSKWLDLIDPKTMIPTPESDKAREEYTIGLYRNNSVLYRPVVDCRMRSNRAKDFCPVCQRAIVRAIEFYTAQ